ncbi:MFS transporter [Streptomyces sp. NPDC059740]|uniref:MFS transporter n=1 Tax=Streptomyces sp. NPDC059740 TaxID=3346926 RepID=UPI00364B2BE3
MSALNKSSTTVSASAQGDGRPAPLRIRRARAALTAFFALDGFVFAGWLTRIPAVKAQTGASAGSLGLALLGVSAGAVACMLVTGRLCRRWGTSRVTVLTGAALSLSVALPPLTHSALALGGVLLAFGAAYGALNVAMNSGAVDVIAALRRPVMPSFHAAFSLGGMAGSALGGLLAGFLSPTRHLLLLTVAGLLVTAVAGYGLRGGVPAGPGQPTASAPRRTADRGVHRGVRRPVLLFGLIALCTAYGEGAMADWGALHLSQDLHASAGLAAAGYSAFALAMAAGRVTGTWTVRRLGRTRTLLWGGLVAAAGLLLGALAPNVPLAYLGFLVAGAGLANIFPLAVAGAGALGGPSGVATASTVGYGGMLAGPPAIGFLAEALSLPAALTSLALLAAAAGAVAPLVRDAEGAAAPSC